MQASIPHFCSVVERIESNSWWAANLGSPSKRLQGFTYTDNGQQPPTITAVPTEPLESLVLHVRKLTLNDAPEHLVKVKKALKAAATTDYDPQLLDLWQKYWRVAFICNQFQIEVGGVKEFMTTYRVYDCFTNGRLFHSNDPVYNQILYGNADPIPLSRPSLFLQNAFHSAVANLCFAAIGLKKYVENGCTFGPQITMQPMPAFEFILYRKRMTELDEMYRAFNDEIPKDCSHARWS